MHLGMFDLLLINGKKMHDCSQFGLPQPVIIVKLNILISIQTQNLTLSKFEWCLLRKKFMHGPIIKRKLKPMY